MRHFWHLPKSLTIMVVFALHAFVLGSLFSRIAEIQKALDLSEASFGLALMGVPAGVFIGSPLFGRFIETVGPRKTLIYLMPAFAACPLMVAFAFGPISLFAGLFMEGLMLTIGNIAMNVEADRIEAETGRRIINRCHGSWGLGFLIISSAGAGAIALGLSPAVFFALVLAIVSLASFLLIIPMVESPPRSHSGTGPARRFAMPSVATFLILGYAVSGVWLEGATRNWAIIYTRDVFGTEDWLAALSLPAFVSTQTAGRFMADGLIDRFGVVLVSRILTIIGTAGLLMITFGNSIVGALIGFSLIGFGISTVHPQSISAVARWGDRSASENIAAFSAVQTLIVFVSPPLFGFVAAQYGLRASFMLILPFPLLALYFARYLGHPGNAASAVEAKPQ